MRAVLLLVAAAVAGPTAAQSSLRSHNTDAPLDVDARTIDVQDAKGQATWAGDVHIKQGDMKLDADTVTVFYSRAKAGGDPVIDRLDAQNNVRLTTPSETASGRYGIYDVARKTITLVGGVTLTHSGGSVLHGQRLAIDLDSGRSKLDGASTGPVTPGAPAATGGRVTGRFVVPQRGSK